MRPLFALALSLAACSPDSGTGPRSCVSASDCRDGEACIDARCVRRDAGAATDGGGCPAAQVMCASGCVDPRTSDAHCGGCGISCLAGTSCVAGACVADCAETEVRCGAACVDTTRDAAHCGMCDAACESGLVCEAGSCVVACTPTEPPTEICDGVDNDCDGATDPECAEGLVAWYRFDESEGMVLDASGNGLHGEAAGGMTRGIAGRAGSAANFDGAAGTHVSVADHALHSFGTALTAEAWIYPVDCSHADSGHNTVIAKEGEILLAFNNSCRVANYVSNGSWTGDFPDTLIPPGRWTHLAMSYDGATIRSYVDGNAVGSGTAMTGPVTDSAATLFVGERPDCCVQTFHGRIDEVKLWNVVRTPQQICEDAGAIWHDDGVCRR